MEMKEYTPTIRARMVARLMGPNAISATALSKETGISQATLSRWKKGAAKMTPMPKKVEPKPDEERERVTGKRTGKRSGVEKLALVERAAGLEGEELGGFLRREGLHMAELEQWRKIASEALGRPKRQAPSKELRQVRAELARKEKALAETAALLVLKKKVAEIWGDEDDDTDGRSG